MSTIAKVALAAAAILGAIAGWHYYNCTKLEQVLSAASAEYLHDVWPEASAHVEISPISNLASIVVERDPVTERNLVTLIEDAFIEGVRSELEPHLERELELAARARMDLYAMALPYRVSITIDDRTQADENRGWNERVASRFAQGCIEGIVDSTRRDYYERARSVGDANPRPFSDELEELVREAFGPMCTCIAKEAVTRFEHDELERLESEPARLEAFMKQVSGAELCNAQGAVERMMESLR